MPAKLTTVIVPVVDALPVVHALYDDGLVPNNALLPLVIYPGALPLLGGEPEKHLIALFSVHGWRGAWINGIYPFQHYHSNAHEVLGLARGSATVQFGGPRGPVLNVTAGDAVIIPAGVGHCRLDAAADLSVVGAYPLGQEAVDLMRATPADRTGALDRIARVSLPENDPVFGRKGPLSNLWKLHH